MSFLYDPLSGIAAVGGNSFRSSVNKRSGGGSDDDDNNFPLLKRAKVVADDEQTSVHVLFAIDQSGSMRLHDVKKGKKMISRWKAVFDSAREFVDSQAAGGSHRGILVSLILWNTNATVVFTRERLDSGPGAVYSANRLKDLLTAAEGQHAPRDGTHFAKAFQTVNTLVRRDQSALAFGRDRVGRHLVVFLSDGRPGDLQSKPPTVGALQLTYRVSGVDYDSAPTEIEKLRAETGADQDEGCLELCFVGIYKDGFPWLRRLAEEYGGKFFETTLDMEDDLLPPPVPAVLARQDGAIGGGAIGGVAGAVALGAGGIGGGHAGNTAMRATTVGTTGMRSTFAAISSLCTSMRDGGGPRVERDVELDRDDAGWGQSFPRGSSSSGGGGGAAASSSAVPLEPSGAGADDTFCDVVKMELRQSANGTASFKLNLKKNDPICRVVRLRRRPFAQGGLRNVYRFLELVGIPESLLGRRITAVRQRAEQTPAELVPPLLAHHFQHDWANAVFPPEAASLSGKKGVTDRNDGGGDHAPLRMVAKESRHHVPYAERLKFHIESSKCQERAQALATHFNTRLAETTCPHLHVLRSEVYRIRDVNEKGGFRYLAVEPELRGRYEKFNSNNGFVLSSGAAASSSAAVLVASQWDPCEVAQAFSHFTYEQTNGREICVDIQGAGFCYTDPQFHSLDGSYGRADLKVRGMRDFFGTHRCGRTCRVLALGAAATP